MKNIFFVIAMAILGISAFLAKSDATIVMNINRWQTSLLSENKYFPVLTVFIISIPPLLLLALIRLLLLRKSS